MQNAPVDSTRRLDAARSRKCPVASNGQCEFSDPEPFTDRSGMVGEVSVIRCRHCGIGLSCPSLTDVAFLYADRSSQDFQRSSSRVAHLVKWLAFGLQARELMRQADVRPRRIIDFGCGSGLFTRRLADILPQSEVIGVDFHEAPPANLDESSYRSFGQLDQLASSADLVIAMHVLEHDDDSMALLRRIIRLVRPGGRIVLEVPNIDCIWAQVFGTHWDAWYLPYHRVHFSGASLRGLVASAGLKIERQLPVSVPTMGRTVANLTGRSNSLPFILLGAAAHPIQWAVERIARRSSAWRIIASVPR